MKSTWKAVNLHACAVALFSYLPRHEAAFGGTTTGFGEKKERKIRIKTALLGRTGLPHKNMFDHRGNSEELRRGQTFVMRGI